MCVEPLLILAAPLHGLTKANKLKWTKKYDDVFQLLKRKISMGSA